MKRYHVNARRWFDKINGNTYHSVAVTFPNGTIKVHPMTYGYGNQWEYTAFEMIAGEENTRHPNGNPVAPWRWYQEHDIAVSSDCVDVTRKRDLHKV